MPLTRREKQIRVRAARNLLGSARRAIDTSDATVRQQRRHLEDALDYLRLLIEPNVNAGGSTITRFAARQQLAATIDVLERALPVQLPSAGILDRAVVLNALARADETLRTYR